METEDIYDLVVDAVRTALAEERGSSDAEISNRMARGEVLFRDEEGRLVKEIPAATLFKKVTSVREKLRVMEQKINNSKGLDQKEIADLQSAITRCYGSLTTFNFLFADPKSGFKGSGGR